MKDTNKSKPLNNISGFSLLEIMIAVFIIAVALSTILYSEILSLRASAKIKNIDTAIFLASSKMSEIEAEGFPPTGEKEGDFGNEFPAFKWKQRIIPTPNPSVRELRVQVIINEGNTEDRIELITYIADLK